MDNGKEIHSFRDCLSTGSPQVGHYKPLLVLFSKLIQGGYKKTAKINLCHADQDVMDAIKGKGHGCSGATFM